MTLTSGHCILKYTINLSMYMTFISHVNMSRFKQLDLNGKCSTETFGVLLFALPQPSGGLKITNPFKAEIIFQLHQVHT